MRSWQRPHESAGDDTVATWRGCGGMVDARALKPRASGHPSVGSSPITRTTSPRPVAFGTRMVEPRGAPDPIREQIDDDLSHPQFRADLDEWLNQVEDDEQPHHFSHSEARRTVGLPPLPEHDGPPGA